MFCETVRRALFYLCCKMMRISRVRHCVFPVVLAGVLLSGMPASGFTALLQSGAKENVLSGAGPVHLAAIVGKDDRTKKIPKAYRKLARSVGAVFTGKAMCSAVCVAPDVVLTSAHCLVDRRGRLPAAISRYMFVFDVKKRRSMARIAGDSARAKRRNVLLGGGYQGHAENRDWAALRLSRPVCSGRNVPFDQSGSAAANAAKSRHLINIAFHADSKHTPLYSGRCRRHERLGGRHAKRFRKSQVNRREVLLHTCDSLEGSSGSPIFGVPGKGTPRLLAINQGTVSWSLTRGRKRVASGRMNIAVRVSSFVDRLARFVDEAPLEGDLAIAALQSHLARAGLYTGRIDSIPGPKTKRAIELFEKRMRLGRLGHPTRRILALLRKHHPDPAAESAAPDPEKVPEDQRAAWRLADADPDTLRYRAYLARWPSGAYAELARRRLELLNRGGSASRSGDEDRSSRS